MNERRRDFVLVVAGASVLLAMDWFLPHACAEKTAGDDAAKPSATESAEEATIG